jgi:hypothetical protein
MFDSSLDHPGAQEISFTNEQFRMNDKSYYLSASLRWAIMSSIAAQQQRASLIAMYHNPDTPRLLKSLLFPLRPHARCRLSLLQIRSWSFTFFGHRLGPGGAPQDR